LSADCAVKLKEFSLTDKCTRQSALESISVYSVVFQAGHAESILQAAVNF